MKQQRPPHLWRALPSLSKSLSLRASPVPSAPTHCLPQVCASHAQGCGKQKNRPPKRVVCLAGAERLELSTRGFGDRCSTN